jgi:hypothetical protein
MDAWQSHCPRFTLWEDALEAGLIEIESCSSSPGSAQVRLTSRGQACRRRSDQAGGDDQAVGVDAVGDAGDQRSRRIRGLIEH